MHTRNRQWKSARNRTRRRSAPESGTRKICYQISSPEVGAESRRRLSAPTGAGRRRPAPKINMDDAKIEDDAAAAACFIAIVGLSEALKPLKKRKRRKMWMQPWIAKRKQQGAYYALMQELHANDSVGYRNFLRMDAQSFQLLLNKVGPNIERANTQMRQSISAEERLAVTLRYLATGYLCKI